MSIANANATASATATAVVPTTQYRGGATAIVPAPNLPLQSPFHIQQEAIPHVQQLFFDKNLVTDLVIDYMGMTQKETWEYIKARQKELIAQGYFVFAHAQDLSAAFYTDLITAIVTDMACSLGRREVHFRLPGVAADMPQTARAFIEKYPAPYEILDGKAEFRLQLIALDSELENECHVYDTRTGETAREFFFDGYRNLDDVQPIARAIAQFCSKGIGNVTALVEEIHHAACRSLEGLNNHVGRCTLFAFNKESIQIVYRAHPMGRICREFEGRHLEGLTMDAQGRLPVCTWDPWSGGCYKEYVQGRLLAGALPHHMHNIVMETYDNRPLSQRREYEQTILFPLARKLRALWQASVPRPVPAAASAAASAAPPRTATQDSLAKK